MSLFCLFKREKDNAVSETDETIKNLNTHADNIRAYAAALVALEDWRSEMVGIPEDGNPELIQRNTGLYRSINRYPHRLSCAFSEAVRAQWGTIWKRELLRLEQEVQDLKDKAGTL